MDAERRRHTLGCSWYGVVVVALALAPNALLLRWPDLLVLGEAPIWLTVVQDVARAAFFAVLVLWVSREVPSWRSRWLVGAVAALLAYFALWGLLLAGIEATWVPLAMAVAPVCYFGFAAQWLHVPVALAPIAVFGVAHIVATWIGLTARGFS